MLAKTILVLCLMLISGTAASAGQTITVVAIDTRKETLALFLTDERGRPFGSFSKLSAFLARRKQVLSFAMNAGMYHPDRRPVGLFVVDGHEQVPLNRALGHGNFFLKPNGVFAMTDSGPVVVESSGYPALARTVRFATQSGPMLVYDGAINPRFSADSTSRLIRNGVCAQGATVYFAISEAPVNFHEFALYFKEELKCRNALYLDGTVSSLYSAKLGRNDARAMLGPIIAVSRVGPLAHHPPRQSERRHRVDSGAK